MTNTQNTPPASVEEKRVLDGDELEMADMARHPALGELSDRDLSDLISRLRSRRNRARDIGNRQAREARSKSAPAGATPATGNAGTLSKHDYLSAALERAMAERTARGGAADDSAEGEDGNAPTQHELALKQAGEEGPNPMMEDGGALHPDDPDASEGKAPLADQKRRVAPSGAFEDVGDKPSRERSRTRY